MLNSLVRLVPAVLDAVIVVKPETVLRWHRKGGRCYWMDEQITEAFPWKEAPKYMHRDRDACYGAVFGRRLDAMGIRDRPVAPRSPWQNGYVEGVIGSIRRECTDHTIVMGEEHLRRTLKSYTHYYNRARTHLSLAKDAPIHRPIRAHGSLFATPHLGGLHHEYGRVT